ncbi:MAG: metalloprotease [Bacteroidia bacterium]|nr:metalloprotease [Bacteroidia bacterium]NNK69367.1 metalloprotease [Flavobacteriaceae bacterium]NNL79033.1 metalloprotease [Flavobacteriaceae bacterium]
MGIFAQNKIDINATFDIDDKKVQINQSIEYRNESDQALDTIYLNDWANSYSTKLTPLAVRFAEEYNTKFHFAKSEDRGYTVISRVMEPGGPELQYSRLSESPDVIKVALPKPLEPGQNYNIQLLYNIQLPSNKFTDYGISAFKEVYLKYWYITPAIFDGKWHYFSNKDLDDMYIPKADINLQISIPNNYVAISELDEVTSTHFDNNRIIVFSGKDRVDTRLFLKRLPNIKTIQTDDFIVVSDIDEKGLLSTDKAIITDKITRFVTEYLGPYPHEKLLVTNIDARRDPVYGLNQLPDFIRPFPEHFQFELTLLKNVLGNYLSNTLLLNPRTDQWVKDGVQIYFLMKYMDVHYPDMKLLGTLANTWGIRSFHAADLKFNEQYGLTYMHTARTNRDQKLSMPKDSLTKFNQNLANKYKAGVGLKYLDDFINNGVLEPALKDFLKEYGLRHSGVNDFESFLKSRTEKDIDWFFNDYVNTRKKIDFKIRKVKQSEDSITLTIINKRDSEVPISLFTMSDDSVLTKSWISDIEKARTLTIPKGDANKLVLNYDNTIPEYNLRDNWKSLKGLFFNSKPLQFRLFKDFEDPHYSQVFIMPMVEFKNIYDGLTLGGKIYNKTAIRRPFNYRFTPQYATKSKSLTGSATLLFYQDLEDSDLFRITYGISGSYRSYAEDLFVRRIGPSISFNFRDKNDLRSNKYEYLNIRYLDINRDADINNISNVDEPNYAVFNTRFIHSDDNLINFNRWFTDFQISKTFGKLSFNYEYRKLFESNRQLILRMFAGTFLYNNNPADSDYFSFALDRPTDYLFDYNYLGRSEDSGIFSQQIIIAEGGFKSKLDVPFANQWMTTANLSTTIWRYIQAYGDVGLIKNKGISPKFVYDAGIRINLVTDYFEIYLPVYSNNGWEISQKNYDEKIRFLFTVDPQTLLGLFRRRWY